ncbi:MAG: endolytic transglycosylase MltG, partial [Polyangiaceae bacterium]
VEPSAHPRADTAEGFLFPATYDFPIDSDPQEVVARLVREGVARLARMKQRHADGFETLRDELGFDDRAVITLASMVEKEAAVAEERALIASVFLNRLRRDDYPHLQSDPTAVYGCYAMPDEIPACKGFTGKATPAINRDRTNVFSTYVTPGLPPGPVGNPGEASIESVLNPADTSYLFFVAKGKGRHEFTEDYESHTRAVERLRAMRP